MSFLAPFARGEPLTPELLAHKPDPYYIDPPERGGLPDMFDAKHVWTVSEKVKAIIEDLEPGIHTFRSSPSFVVLGAALELTFFSTSGK